MIERKQEPPKGFDLNSRLGRAMARLHFEVIDHALLRRAFWNISEVAPGVWRSNQPSESRIARMKDMGIRTIVTLRGGPENRSFIQLERRSCDSAGIRLIQMSYGSARKPPQVDLVRRVLHTLETAPKPVLFHCKSGADRSGLLAALYLAIVEGVPVEVAERELSLRRHHLRLGRSGVLSQIFRSYRAQAPDKTFAEWFWTDYDPRNIEADFRAWRRRLFGLLPVRHERADT